MDTFEMDAGGRENYQKKDRLASTIWGMVLITPISWIVAWSMYRGLLYKKRQKPSVAYFTGVGVILLAVLAGAATSALPKFLYVVQNLPIFTDIWTDLIPFILVSSVIIGALEGMALIAYEAYYISRNVSNTHDSSSWKYNFKYARSPFENMREKKLVQKFKNAEMGAFEKAPMGLEVENSFRDISHERSPVYMYLREAVRQTAIFGTAGSGKSITMLSLIYNSIRFGNSTLMIDFKNSPELASKLATWAKENGGNFYHFTTSPASEYDITNSPGQVTYDPLATTTDEAATGIILGMREWDAASAVYRQGKEQVTGTLLKMLGACDRSKAKGIVFDQGNLYALASATNKVALANLVRACEGTSQETTAEALLNGVNDSKSAVRNGYNELAGDMMSLFNSSGGEWLRSKPGVPALSLLDAMLTPGNVVLFSFNSDSEENYSKLLGSLLFGDLNAVSAELRSKSFGKDNTLAVFVDEFQVLPPTAFRSLLEKGRESGIAMTIASQSIEQVVVNADSNGEAIKKALLETCGNFIVHSGSTYDTSEELLSLVGKAPTQKYITESRPLLGPFRDLLYRSRIPNARIDTSDEWKINPSVFQELSIPGIENNFKQEAVLINKFVTDPTIKATREAVARVVELIPNSEVVRNNYYQGQNAEKTPAEIAALKQANIDAQAAYQAKMEAELSNEFNMSPEDDHKRLMKNSNDYDAYFSQGYEATTHAEDYDQAAQEFEQIQTYVAQNQHPYTTNFGTFDVAENTYENFGDFDNTSEVDVEVDDDGGFGWDDDEMDNIIAQVPESPQPQQKQRPQVSHPQQKSAAQRPQQRPEVSTASRQASLQQKSNAPRPQQGIPSQRKSQPPAKIEGFGSLFEDKNAKPQSMKDIQSQQKQRPPAKQPSAAQEQRPPQNQGQRPQQTQQQQPRKQENSAAPQKLSPPTGGMRDALRNRRPKN